MKEAPGSAHAQSIRLGLRENLGQFILLSATTFWVGWIVGMERVAVPILGDNALHIASYVALLGFIVSFGITKAPMNFVSGALADRVGRRPILLVGWLVAIPIPFLLIFAPDWSWVVLANLLLGVNQGMTWSMAITSKIDLVGPMNRGFATGIDEFAGYGGVSIGGFAGGALSAIALRTAPYELMLAVLLVAFAMTLVAVRETRPWAQLEGRAMPSPVLREHPPSLWASFRTGTWGDASLGACAQAGLVEKFVDTLAWGLLPVFLLERGLSLVVIGGVVATYTGSWALLQIPFGHLSDRWGRKPWIVGGMWLAGLGVLVVGFSDSVVGWWVGALLAGTGMAALYPTLIAAVSDAAAPARRGAILGVYRFWRDSGYVAAGVLLGFAGDILGLRATFLVTAGLMGASGFLVAVLLRDHAGASGVVRFGG